MSRSKLLGGAISFAHLMGRPTHAASASKPSKEDEAKAKAEEDEEDEPDDKRDDETMEEYRARKKREQEEEDEDKEDAKKAKAKADEEDDDEDEKDKKDPKAMAARMRERARCAAIFGSKAAGSRPDMAAHFAFSTDMSRSAAVQSLRAISAGEPARSDAPPAPARRSAFSERMDRRASPSIGNDGGGEPSGEDPHKAQAKRMLALAGINVK